jgi:hypothetical protein
MEIKKMPRKIRESIADAVSKLKTKADLEVEDKQAKT